VPQGFQLINAVAIGDSGHILAYSTAGYVMLTPEYLSYTPSSPLIAGIDAPTPVAVNTLVNFSAAFNDGNTTDTHVALWSWDDGTSAASGQLSEAVSGNQVIGTTTASHTFAQAGVYNVNVRVTDSHGDWATVTKEIVAYDPSAGFVTGGGWIMSPPGAYKADQGIVGRATFAFVSKYQKGATIPTGNTEFRFQAASLMFTSDTYDWLVVSGARAQYKGVGLYNGQDGYKFLLTAVDGGLIAKGMPDRFRIKIWHTDSDKNDVVDYDNQTDSSTVGTNNEGTAIGGGSIQVHK
jgi:hypothetical protein